MSLVKIILLSIATVFTVAGIHRSMVENDIVSNYWLFMVSFVCLMLYRYQNKKK